MGYIGGVLSTGWEIPAQVFPLESFGLCAIAVAKFTAVSKATVAPASSRVFNGRRRITAAVGQLANNTPSGPVH